MTEKKKVTFEEILKLPMYIHTVASPDGNNIVVMSNKTEDLEFYLFNVKSKEFTPLTSGDIPISFTYAPIWTHDSNNILFISDGAGNERFDFFKIDVNSKEISQVTKSLEYSDLFGQINSKNNQIAFFSDRAGNGKTQIYTCDLDGKNLKQHTDFQGMMFSRRITFPWSNLKYSPDESIIYFTGNLTKFQKNFSLFQVELKSNEISEVLSIKNESKEILADVSAISPLILFQSDESGISRAGLLNTSSKKIQWFGNNTRDETPLFLTSDDRYVIVIRDEHAEKIIIIYNVENGSETIPEFHPGVMTSIHIPNSHKILIMHTNSISKAALYLYDIDTNESSLLYQSEYGDYVPERDFHPDDYISYPSTFNATIHAILYKPKDLIEGKKYPAIIEVHGGPTSHYSRLFSPIDQVFVDNGFIILKPNFRGSTGYGAEFRDACINDHGGKDMDDIEAGLNYLKSLDYVDSKRIGLKGGSYGGFMTYLTLTKRPKLFNVGAAIVGVTDLLLQYETVKKLFPWMAQLAESQMGVPDNEKTINIWKDRSAVNFAHLLEAKLLIIHTANDPRVPVNQAEVFRDKLIEYKKDHLIDYIIYENQGHGSLKKENLVKTHNTILNFFIKNL